MVRCLMTKDDILHICPTDNHPNMVIWRRGNILTIGVNKVDVETMFIRILLFIYMFLMRLRFQSSLLAAKIRKFEKLEFRRRKTQLDITFLEVCHAKDIPNFLRFRTANSKLGNSEAYSTCQRILFNQELNNKIVKLKVSWSFKEVTRDLSNLLTSINFLFLTSLFLEKNVRISEEIELTQNAKLSKLVADNPKHEVNYLDFQFFFTYPPMSLLWRVWIMLSLPKTLNMRIITWSSFSWEHYIQKAGKGNITVLSDKSTYIEKMESILADTSKFTHITFSGDILEKEQDINIFLNKLIGSAVIALVQQKMMCPKGSTTGILYDNCKVHRVVPEGKIPPFFLWYTLSYFPFFPH